MTTTLKHQLIKQLVQTILEEPFKHDWTLQGFGMLRTYLPGKRDIRLHVWDDRYTVTNVSMKHTHPWDFTSYIVVGSVVNHKYLEYYSGYPDKHNFWKQKIVCGEGGGLAESKDSVMLNLVKADLHLADETYSQEYDEIHSSHPSNGTVTLVTRTVPEGKSADAAYVYWEKGNAWVSAEPRKATNREILDITELSLNKYFK